MNIGKKILSAFVEVSDKEKESSEPPAAVQNTSTPVSNGTNPASTGKFQQHFDKLFAEANIPGPDYFEFSKMVDVMSVIPDEKARYAAAFAGLTVQGLDKQKLLSTANEYIRLLEADATAFRSTIDQAVQEKIQAKQAEVKEKAARIQQLSQEITELQNRIVELDAAIKENEEKIYHSTEGYAAESEERKRRIQVDMEKIEQHIE
ncbi:hypothetical protein [Flavisolibacter tropicus]|uniref:Uncharacterized protein n=1 Tax=Flavisolibacter tropicus TaxID=1492898 RepID=A0A172TTQ3_9BACT|nr:hypothetical protein [Flavisolibacter tropicus]ANE50382.1 hypothetical protein SY85_07620 [Flavisolibacter tropicus]